MQTPTWPLKKRDIGTLVSNTLHGGAAKQKQLIVAGSSIAQNNKAKQSVNQRKGGLQNSLPPAFGIRSKGMSTDSK